MSRDIRSFFKTSPSCQKKSSSSSTTDIVKKHNNKKRAIVISDSDEDEDFVSPKRTKPSVNGKLQNCKSKEKDDPKNVSKSKYFPVASVNVSDVFGSGPIKRDNSRKIVKKTVVKEEKEFHLDKDFESELLKLDNDIEILQQSLPDGHSNKETASSAMKILTLSAPLSSPKQKKKDSDSSSESNTISRKKQKFDSESADVKLENSIDNEKLPNKESVEPKFSKQSEGFKSDKQTSQKITPPTKVSKTSPSTSPRTTCTANESKIKMDSPPKNKLFGTSPEKFKNTNECKEGLINGVINNNDIIKVKQKNQTNEKSQETSRDTSKPEIKPENKNVGSGDVLKQPSLPCNLWVEKYKPTTTKQIIGQQGEKSCVSKLKTWLQNWQKNQSSGKKFIKPSPWAKNDDGAYFKAALLSGPPGVGKTTTAHLVCKELGLDVVEFNASDTRSKKSLDQEVSELLSSSSLSSYCTGDPDEAKRVSRQHVLVMDEVDGMAGNEDRGGVQQLIALIKGARVPVVCMCNDRNHPKIRSLANYCFDLRFSKPRAEQIRGAMMSVCFKEKIKITPDAITEIIMSSNQDIRLILNHLSMLTAENMKIASGSKHIKLGPWDITRKIFSEEEHKTMSLNDKCDLFFHDYSVTPLFVQENYLHAVPHKPEAKNKISKMEMFARAARSISYGDLTERSIRSHNAWGLLPVQAIFSSYVPGEVLGGHIGAQISFPAWFGKNSRQNKMSRLVQELTVHSRLKISGNREAMNLDYLDPLESHILSPLISQGVEGVPLALSALSEYTLVREDIESLSELCSWPNSISRFSRVDSKVKAAFTRAYNKANVVTPYAAAPIKKASRTDVDTEVLMGEEGEGETQEDDNEDGDDDGLQSDAMIVVKKKAPSKRSDKEEKPSSSKGNKNSKRGKKK